ncbi:hypothetical protein TWF696_002745 [Orbilia brochopaga]|uniref:Uncharacterized protein n=1 Tax=Orbilia brochopaga TaxID=3140254 RepID=A0AAV9U317_9PEZI
MASLADTDVMDSQSQASDTMETSESPQSLTALRQAVDSFSVAAALTRKRKRGSPGLDGSNQVKQSPTETRSSLFTNPQQPATMRGSTSSSKATSQAASVISQQRLDVPIPNLHRLRHNRQTAYTTTKETLERWLDTVKSMRDAEQLTFPTARQTKDNDAVALSAPPLAGLGESPRNLESMVAQVLSTDAVAPGNKTRKPISTATFKRSEDKRAHIAHLRMERELILRREAKAKRLKRIKSKTYRRILKREAQRIANKVGDSDAEADDDDLAPMKDESGLRRSIDHQFHEPEGSQPQRRSDKSTHTSESHLSKMKFMAEAEERRLKLESAGTKSETSVNLTGRRIFHDGLSHGTAEANVSSPMSNVTQPKADRNGGIPLPKTKSKPLSAKTGPSSGDANPWLANITDANSHQAEATYKIKTAPIDTTNDAISTATEPNVSRARSPPTILADQSCLRNQSVSSPQDRDPGSSLSQQKADLLLRAFAGDNVLQEAFKDAEIQPKPEPERPAGGIPGWGTWSSSARPRDSNKVKKPTASSSLKSAKVSISNKYSKKSAKYVASGVPFPFETREQYERSLRFPMGQEWSTKQIHQNLSAPRTIVEVGRAIAPLSIPR